LGTARGCHARARHAQSKVLIKRKGGVGSDWWGQFVVSRLGIPPKPISILRTLYKGGPPEKNNPGPSRVCYFTRGCTEKARKFDLLQGAGAKTADQRPLERQAQDRSPWDLREGKRPTAYGFDLGVFCVRRWGGCEKKRRRSLLKGLVKSVVLLKGLQGDGKCIQKGVRNLLGHQAGKSIIIENLRTENTSLLTRAGPQAFFRRGRMAKKKGSVDGTSVTGFSECQCLGKSWDLEAGGGGKRHNKGRKESIHII